MIPQRRKTMTIQAIRAEAEQNKEKKENVMREGQLGARWACIRTASTAVAA